MFSSLFGGNDAKDNLSKRFTIDNNKRYGAGGYGATYSAYDNETKEPLAVKVIDTKRSKMDTILKECAILESLDHPNIIKIRAHGQKGEHYYIFMELASGGELFDQVIDRGANAMPEDVARGFMVQLLDGVKACHDNGIAHRDLKLENVLLNKEGKVKVIDFGLSHRYSKGADGAFARHPLREPCGSKSYAAPEVLNGRGYDGFAADVWSLGVSLFAMLSGFFPLDEATGKDWRYGKLVQAQQQKRSTTRVVYSWYKRNPAHLSEQVVNLIDAMLSLDAARRPTVDQVLGHPWVTGGTDAADQGTYNAYENVEADGPTWRNAIIDGAPIGIDVAMDDAFEDAPVYRSLGFENEVEVPVPGLQRQRACSNLGAAL